MKADIESQILILEDTSKSKGLSFEQKSHILIRMNFLKMVLNAKCSEIGKKVLTFVY